LLEEPATLDAELLQEEEAEANAEAENDRHGLIMFTDGTRPDNGAAWYAVCGSEFLGPERVTMFTDAQAVIRTMASSEHGPGLQYALQARKHIAALRRARTDITTEMRWCPAHKEVEGNQKADKGAKVAAEDPDTHGGNGCTTRTGGGMPHATPAVPCKSQTGDFEERVGGSAATCRRPDH